MLLYTLYIIKAKGLIITLLDKLIQQVETVLDERKALEIENRRLKERVEELSNKEYHCHELESKNAQYSRTIKELTLKLEKLLQL